ncbi:MAG: hypothetical protein MUD14_22155 [Hydrococcus sp. Prado102]|nr:hypothetical protein [Hydrococcus sp. Prado102]
MMTQTALAQRVVDINPGLDSQNVPPDTSISGVFDTSNGTGVDVNSIKIFVNNADVTKNSTITKNFFSYRPTQPLKPGANTVRLEYQNASGQAQSVTWSFAVQPPQAALKITSVTHNAASESLGPGSTFLATINGTPNAKASVLMVADGKTVRTLPAQEVSPGVYVATLNVNKNNLVNEGIAVGRLQGQNQTLYSAASQGVTFSASATTAQAPSTNQTPTTKPPQTAAASRPLLPVFTSHKNGDKIATRGFTLAGRTQPGANVQVTVSYKLPVVGGFINIDVGGGTLVEKTVTSNNQGNFQVEVPPPSASVSGIQYTVQAVAKNKQQTSQPVQLTLTQQ